MIKKLFATFFGLLLGLFLFALGLVTVAVLVTYPKLPALSNMQNYQPREPLTIYSADGAIIGTYGDERRAFTKINEFPQILIDAVIAAEDKRFREHWGVDLVGVARALISNLSGGHKQGASTITQQLARNFYLTNERTFTRKFYEALLAFKIEKTLSKNQILELYFNQIYLGQRAYGFAAAAKIYFNKPVQDLTLSEATILAGLPKAPSAFNPIVNPERAHLRQEYILNNMLELGMITEAQRQEALKEQPIYERHRIAIDQNSLYVAEMARQKMYELYGESAYTRGYKVYTTVKIADQKAATHILRRHLRRHDTPHYHGAEQYFDFSQLEQSEIEEEAERILSNTYTVEEMVPAIVIAANNKQGITVYMQGGKKANLTVKKMGNISRAINNKKMGDKAIQVGAMIRVSYNKESKTWFVNQEPELQGALVSLDVNTGAVRALVGGYDFHNKAFNRATQSIRQPGSTFKPFVYSAALSKGFTASSIVNDAPITIGNWSPQNAGSYSGLITLRQALTWSKNTVSVRITQAMGVSYTREYVQRFGFRPEQIPNSLTLSLGAGSATPMQMAEGYAVFANGGYKISAYVIDKIYDSRNNPVPLPNHYLTARQNAPQVIDPRNAYVMTSILKDVIQRGTATAAKSLKRSDLAGKTGTTNNAKDVWFVGYNPEIVTAVYLGYDTPRSLGSHAFGGIFALPVWIDYMQYALNGKPVKTFSTPKGLVENNGEIYLKERQTTDKRLPIDNISNSNPQNISNTAPLTDDDGETLQAIPPARTATPKSNRADKADDNAINDLF